MFSDLTKSMHEIDAKGTSDLKPATKDVVQTKFDELQIEEVILTETQDNLEEGHENPFIEEKKNEPSSAPVTTEIVPLSGWNEFL